MPEITVKMKNIRAKTSVKATSHKWFHYACWARDNKGFGFAVDFPYRAKSDFTVCAGCKGPINGGHP